MAPSKIIKINKGGRRVDFTWLGDLEQILIGKFKIKKNISVALVSPFQIRKMNRIYRGQNKVTDVLSFNMDSSLVLGEVIICLEQARRQARQRGQSLSAELKLLTVHGILHLLGYDHEQSVRAEKKQQKQEQIILAALS